MRATRPRRLALAFLLGLAATARAAAPAPAVEVRPGPAYIERTRNSQAVNFDFLVSNSTGEALRLRGIEVSVYDDSGRLQVRRSVNDNGNSPGIATVNRLRIGAGEKVLLFNPFHTFDDGIRLSSLAFRFDWRGEKSDRAVSSEATVAPVEYVPKAELRLPMRHRCLVWDGHDFYAHHRRFDYLSPYSVASGTTSNVDRYGHDFVAVNEAGEMYSGDPANNESWFGFGAPIHAAASGKVVASFDGGLDNREVDEVRYKSDKLADYGNYLVVDHGGGEFALYGHIRQGSALAHPGDTVERGQHIADVGASGSSLMPHLHFQLQSGPDTSAEGLPSYFTRFTRVLGSRSVPVSAGPVDSGDFIEPSADPR